MIQVEEVLLQKALPWKIPSLSPENARSSPDLAEGLAEVSGAGPLRGLAGPHPDSVNTSASPCSRPNFRDVKGQGRKAGWSLNMSHKPALRQSACTCDIH